MPMRRIAELITAAGAELAAAQDLHEQADTRLQAAMCMMREIAELAGVAPSAEPLVEDPTPPPVEDHEAGTPAGGG